MNVYMYTYVCKYVYDINVYICIYIYMYLCICDFVYMNICIHLYKDRFVVSFTLPLLSSFVR